MRTEKVAIPFLGLLIAILACGTGSEERDRDAILSLIQNLAHDFETADIQAFVNRGTQDMTFYTLDGRALDRDGTVQFLQPMFNRWSDRRMKLDSVEVFVGPKFAWARYLSTFSFIARAPTTLHSVNTAIFVRQSDSSWRLQHYHMSRSSSK